MSRLPAYGAIHGETLVGYALNYLIRGEDSAQAIESLRRNRDFEHYTTQEIRNAVFDAARLRGQADLLEHAGREQSLSGLLPEVYGENEVVGFRVVFRRSQARWHQPESSVVINLPAGTSKEDVVRAARAYLQSNFAGSSTVGLLPQQLNRPEIYAVLPGGYQRDVP